MSPFRRRAAPAFWRVKEETWKREAAERDASAALHGWRHEGRSLAELFHQHVREEGEPALCAYCDGPLLETSPQTIDHFVPQHLGRACGHSELGLAWENLYPACAVCNSSHKKGRWSPFLLRPDAAPVSALFSIDAATGALEPAPEASRADQERVTRTIGLLGLNTVVRCKARLRILRELQRAEQERESALFEDLVSSGPYRFLARGFERAANPLR